MARSRYAGPGREALRAAANEIARSVKAAAAKFSTRIPDVVTVRPYRDYIIINAGKPGGEWGWTPIHAWMFEEPHVGSIPKHPLFKNRKHWYYQPYRPFMEEGAEAALDAAEETYVEGCVKEWGFK